MMGKTAGRWTKEEHKKFVTGKYPLNLNRDSLEELREGLEARGGLRANAVGRADPVACPEVLHQNLKETQGQLGRLFKSE